MKKWKAALIAVVVGGVVITSIVSNVNASNQGAKLESKKFKNTEIEYKSDFGVIWDIIKERFSIERKVPVPVKDIPVLPMTSQQIMDAPNNSAVKLGHSSIMLKLEGQIVMIDPVFSDRASPVQWAGPKRFHQPPIAIKDIQEIDVVIISHDHYDHLDKGTIKAIKDKVGTFLVPLNVGKHLVDWGVAAEKVVELDWWQSKQVGGVEFTATPTQHFSGRGLLDRDETLWASWVINSPESKIFFSGDSGYFGGFKEIGEKFGPFDLTFIETGAYNRLWSEIHMVPEESVQAHLDLQGKVMVPIHNSTFDLAMHDWFEPLDRVSELSRQQQVTLSTPIVGEFIDVLNAPAENTWWLAVK
ncbi:MAG: MBL fold metallo-hydrolase [Thalassotalea sp.]|nr:MBL fold metallo-hydrolase [Thalassotalea sp.]